MSFHPNFFRDKRIVNKARASFVNKARASYARKYACFSGGQEEFLLNLAPVTTKRFLLSSTNEGPPESPCVKLVLVSNVGRFSNHLTCSNTRHVACSSESLCLPSHHFPLVRQEYFNLIGRVTCSRLSLFCRHLLSSDALGPHTRSEASPIGILFDSFYLIKIIYLCLVLQ